MASARIATVKVRDREMSGFSVEMSWSPDMGESYELIRHHVIFEDEAEAKRFAEKVREKVRGIGYIAPSYAVDYAHWMWDPSAASYDRRLQVPSTAKPVFRARKFRPWTHEDWN